MKKQLKIILFACSLVLFSSQSSADTVIPIFDKEIVSFIKTKTRQNIELLWNNLVTKICNNQTTPNNYLETIQKNNTELKKITELVKKAFDKLSRDGDIHDLKDFCTSNSLINSRNNASRAYNLAPSQKKQKPRSLDINQTPTAKQLTKAITQSINRYFEPASLATFLSQQTGENVRRPDLNIRITQRQDGSVTVTSYPTPPQVATAIDIDKKSSSCCCSKKIVFLTALFGLISAGTYYTINNPEATCDLIDQFNNTTI